MLVKIPASMIDSALAVRGQEGDVVRKKYEFSNLIKIKPKRANGRVKFLSREIESTTKYLQSLLTFSYAFVF